MVKNGIDRILISVADMEESLVFYRDIIGFTIVADEPRDPGSIQRHWNLPEGTGARSVYLKNEEQTTILELVEFQPHSGRYIRGEAKTYDYGLFDVAFRTKDVDRAYKDLRDRGYGFISKPVVYSADWAQVTVKEAIMVGPNRMPIALIERLTGAKPVIRGEFGTMVDSAQFVEDIDALTPFYVDILGMTKVFDRVLPTGLIDEIVRLPSGTESRMAFVAKPGNNAVVIELIQCSVKGTSLGDIARPPNLGLFALGFETGNLSSLKGRFRDGGYPIRSEPEEMTMGGYEKVRTITVVGPNGVLLEFFER